MTIIYNIRLFGFVCGHLVYFTRIGLFGPRKIWQPCFVVRAGSGLQNEGSGQARALNCGLGLFAGLGDYLVKSGLGSCFY
jgi:hypothetical protein